VKIRVDHIKKDAKLSPRIDTGTSPDVVKGYQECYDQLPPIVVFKIPDVKKYVLADGWHRLTAAENLGFEEVEADVKYGTWDDAKEFALLSNLRHGQALTRREKRHVVVEFIKLHPERSNNWIAKDTGTTRKTVETIREKLEAGCEIHTLEVLIGQDGKEYPRTIEQPKQEETEETEETQETEPEVPTVPMLGPYALNEVHHEDCIVGLASLPGDSIDLVFADPRYNIGVDYGSGNQDNMSTEDYFRWCMQWFMGVYRVLKPGGAFYVMHYPEVAAQWKQQLDRFLTFQRWITWTYPQNVGHVNGNWTRAQRTILYYVKGRKPAYFNGLADPQPYRNPDDIRVKHTGREGVTPYDWWEYNLVKNVSKEKTPWPNQLPVDLVWRIVATSCPENGIVCDPAMGSGTTAVAAIRTGRSWIGFDIEPKACEVARERIAAYGTD
jgi:site-specific DNA-methyltransferase (adenine-specific)